MGFEAGIGVWGVIVVRVVFLALVRSSFRFLVLFALKRVCLQRYLSSWSCLRLLLTRPRTQVTLQTNSLQGKQDQEPKRGSNQRQENNSNNNDSPNPYPSLKPHIGFNAKYLFILIIKFGENEIKYQRKKTYGLCLKFNSRISNLLILVKLKENI